MSEALPPAGNHHEGDSGKSPSRFASRNTIAAANTSPSSPQTTGARSGCVDSTDLLRGEKTVEISHNGSTYRLQATRLGKLILTK